MQEDGEADGKSLVALSEKGFIKDIGKPQEIYENIINNPPDKEKKDPLTHLALLKLAILHQEEKNLDKSLNALKKLFKEYPRASLGK